MTVKRTADSIPPGWVDLQVNGHGGVDFSAPGLRVDDVRRATEALVKRGTGAYCPTVVTGEPWAYEVNLAVLAAAMAEPDLAPHLLGIHLEGPFLAPAARGAHCEACLQLPSLPLFKHWMELAKGRITMLTLAPELEGAEELIRFAVSKGVVVSLGHHLAEGAVIDRAAKAGATCCTHLGNGIPNILPRHPNPIWSQLADTRLTAMLITDGHHLPPDFVRVALRAKGLEKIVITSDAAPLAGQPPGEYQFAGTTVVSEPGGRISVKGSESLAGSSATMEECMRWLKALGGLSDEDLIRVGRTNPLRVLGLL